MLTLESKPFSGGTVIVDVTLPSCARLNEPGNADSVKFGRGVTVMVTVTVPIKRGGVGGRQRERARAFCALGVNAAVTPVGRPEAERLTLPSKPSNGLSFRRTNGPIGRQAVRAN